MSREVIAGLVARIEDDEAGRTGFRRGNLSPVRLILADAVEEAGQPEVAAKLREEVERGWEVGNVAWTALWQVERLLDELHPKTIAAKAMLAGTDPAEYAGVGEYRVEGGRVYYPLMVGAGLLALAMLDRRDRPRVNDYDNSVHPEFEGPDGRWWDDETGTIRVGDYYADLPRVAAWSIRFAAKQTADLATMDFAAKLLAAMGRPADAAEVAGVAARRRAEIARKEAEKAATEAAWHAAQQAVAPDLPAGYVRREEHDLRANPPAGVIYFRRSYKKGRWSRPAAEKRGQRLTLSELQAMAARK